MNNKFKQIKESAYWKWVYIGLVVFVSVCYWVFAYFYLQESKYIYLGEYLGSFKTRDDYVLIIMVFNVLTYFFLITPFVLNVNKINKNLVIKFLLWIFFAILPYFMFYNL